MEEEDTSIEFIQDIRYEHLNLELIGSDKVEEQIGAINNENSTAIPNRTHCKRVLEEIPLFLSHRDIQATEPDNLNLSELEVIIKKECRAKRLIKIKEPWSLWLSRVADWVCLGSTVIILVILLGVLIFYLFKDRERL